MTQASI
jgi:hypothetical protein